MCLHMEYYVTVKKDELALFYVPWRSSMVYGLSKESRGAQMFRVYNVMHILMLTAVLPLPM